LDLAVKWRGDEAFPHFLKAAQLDTNFVQAKLFALETGSSGPSFRDSLLAAASAARARLTTFDGLSLDRQVAASRHDWETQVVASRRLLRLAPSSEEALYW